MNGAIKCTTIETCTFVRVEGGQEEYGFCLNDGEHIVDLSGQEVAEIYDWQRSAIEGNFEVRQTTPRLIGIYQKR